jgi:hypothetical protein
MSTYRFIKEVPSQELLDDLQNLSNFNDQLYEEVVDLLLGFLSQEEESDLRSAIATLAQVLPSNFFSHLK